MTLNMTLASRELMQPHMPAPSLARLDARLAEAATYLEFGCGGSTVLAARRGVGHIFAVDTSRAWLDRVAADVAALDYAGRLALVHADLGAVRDWGYPADQRTMLQWPSYYTDAWALTRAHGLRPDLVLVDGRFRVACFLSALLNLQPGATILFDDYRDRPEYHVVEEHLRPLRLHDRMAEFAVPGGLDVGRIVQRLFETRYVAD